MARTPLEDAINEHKRRNQPPENHREYNEHHAQRAWQITEEYLRTACSKANASFALTQLQFEFTHKSDPNARTVTVDLYRDGHLVLVAKLSFTSSDRAWQSSCTIQTSTVHGPQPADIPRTLYDQEAEEFLAKLFRQATR